MKLEAKQRLMATNYTHLEQLAFNYRRHNSLPSDKTKNDKAFAEAVKVLGPTAAQVLEKALANNKLLLRNAAEGGPLGAEHSKVIETFLSTFSRTLFGR